MAEATVSLTPLEQQKIEANYANIVTDVRAEDIMDKFVDEGFFTIADVVDEIMKENSGRMERLVSLLSNSKQKAGVFNFFVKQLEDNRHEKLARQIRETEKKPTQVTEGREDSFGYLDIPDKLKDRRVTEEHAMFLSKAVPKSHEFGDCLSLGETEISHIQAEYGKFRPSTVIQQLILRWRAKEGSSAKLKNLLDIFQKNSDKFGLDFNAYQTALEKISRRS
ncbi:uncharacterized protein LOC132563751 [Ylistrum balloti]|uniref:uncharacterized protein LOC132563751 n=1 Tax=Ylistrum balloti TaxID=509963 RepID=UPI002905CD8D|nr:uncharacterized protein LOC132563751 [Ylistrum balloti]